MTTKITIWGTGGKIYADRQECQIYLRDSSPARWQPADEYRVGWNVRYTTDLTTPVGFYLRGEEYSAELDYFITRCQKGEADGENSFDSAVVTDRTMETMINDAANGGFTPYRQTNDDVVPAIEVGPIPGRLRRRPQIKLVESTRQRFRKLRSITDRRGDR